MELRKPWEITVFAFLLLSALSACQRKYSFDESAVDGNYVMPVPETERVREPSYFRMQVNSDLMIEEGDTKLPFMAGNPEDNHQNVQMKVYVDGEEEPFYVSSVLEPGRREVYGSIDRKFQEGEYRLTAVFVLLDPDTGRELGEMEAGVTLTVSQAKK